jgi:hypothetical protein
MTQIKTPRAKIFIAALTAAVVFPAAASAHCGSSQGSYAVTCERGVQVFRHQAPSSLPQGLSPQQAQLEAEKIRAKTQRAQIASNGRIAAANADLRQRELAIQDYRARVYDRNTRRRSSFAGFGGGFGFGGFNNTIGAPFIRSGGFTGLPNTGFRNRDRGTDGGRNVDGRNRDGRNTDGRNMGGRGADGGNMKAGNDMRGRRANSLSTRRFIGSRARMTPAKKY